MLRHRTSILAALMALGATGLAIAQTEPPANSGSSSADAQRADAAANANGGMPNQEPSDSSAPADKMSAQDPKMKHCMKAEKAKDSGLSDNQLKQKCMLQIASHQGQ